MAKAKTMSRETLTVGIIAVVAGLAAAYGVRAYLNQEVEVPPKPKRPAPLQVLLAATDLPADRVLDGHDIVQVPMSRQRFNRRFKQLNPEQVILNASGIISRCLKKPVKRGQPFLTSDFYLDGTGPSVANMLKPGFRAIRVQVPGTRQAGVQAGMNVDVMFRADARPAKAGQLAIPEMTLTLLRHIQVLVAELPSPPTATMARQKLLYTLAVPEASADMFGIIEGRGDVWLVPTPPTGAASGGIEVGNAETLAQLLGIKPRQGPPAPFQTDIYRRGHLHVNRFASQRWVPGQGTHEGAERWEALKPPVPGDMLEQPEKTRKDAKTPPPEDEEEQ